MSILITPHAYTIRDFDNHNSKIAESITAYVKEIEILKNKMSNKT